MSLWADVGRIKPVEASRGDLVRVLQLRDLISFGVGCTIGAGIFVSIGHAAKQSSPNALWLSFLIAALGCLSSGLAYAEMSTRVPISGSAYSYAYAAFGELIAFLVGAMLIFGNVVSAAAVGRSWTGYLHSLMRDLSLVAADPKPAMFELNISSVLSLSPVTFILILAVGLLNAGGIASASKWNNVITIFNAAMVLFFIVAGMFYITINESSYKEDFAPNGTQGILRGSSLVFFSFLGFDMITTLAEETKNPIKTVPRSIIFTIICSCVVYTCVSLVYSGMVTTSTIDSDAPLSSAFLSAGAPKLFAQLIGLGALGNTFTTLVATIVGIPRIIYRMGCDGLLPAVCRKVDKNGVPRWALSIAVLCASLLGGFLRFDLLADTVSVGALSGFSVVSASVLKCRFRERVVKSRVMAKAIRSTVVREMEPLPIGRRTTECELEEYDVASMDSKAVSRWSEIAAIQSPRHYVFSASPVGYNKQSLTCTTFACADTCIPVKPQFSPVDAEAVRGIPVEACVSDAEAFHGTPVKVSMADDVDGNINDAREVHPHGKKARHADGSHVQAHTTKTGKKSWQTAPPLEEDAEIWFSPGFHVVAFSVGMYGISLSWFKNYAGFLYIPWMTIALYGVVVIFYHWCRTTAPPATEATGFRVPLMPFPSILAILINTHLLAGLPAMAFFWSFALCAIACAFYCGYGRHQSLAQERAEATSTYGIVAIRSATTLSQPTIPSRPSSPFFYNTVHPLPLEKHESASAV